MRLSNCWSFFRRIHQRIAVFHEISLFIEPIVFFHMCIDHNCVVCLFATYISAMKSHSPNQSNQLVFALFEGEKSQIVCTQFIVRIALEKELFLIGNNWMGYSFARGFMCAFCACMSHCWMHCTPFNKISPEKSIVHVHANSCETRSRYCFIMRLIRSALLSNWAISSFNAIKSIVNY